MEQADILKLIAAWGTARKIMSPSSTLLASETDNAPLAQLSFLSSRQEYWDTVVCAVGFADMRDLSASDVLIQAAKDVNAPATGIQTRDFLDYCANISSISKETISVVAGLIVAGLGNLSVDPQLLIDFETCYELCGDDDNCLTTCLANKIKIYV
jgi:hypothetical protein